MERERNQDDQTIFNQWINSISKIRIFASLGKGLNRKNRFFFGLVFVTCVYALPLVGFAFAKAFSYLMITFAAFSISIFMVYRMTIRNIKLKYPIVSPEGHPDVYTGRIPRPIYEDMERYPWFFKRKQAKKLGNKKAKKKH